MRPQPERHRQKKGTVGKAGSLGVDVRLSSRRERLKDAGDWVGTAEGAGKDVWGPCDSLEHRVAEFALDPVRSKKILD